MDTFHLAGTFELNRSDNAALQVYAYLRNAIVALELKPAASLDRDELAEYFGVSITPVRDALLRLQEEELVDVFPQHRTRVRAIDLDSARNACFLRRALEAEVVRMLALRRDRTIGRRILGAIERQRMGTASGQAGHFLAADAQVRALLFAEADMSRLWRMLHSKSGNIDRLRRLDLELRGDAVPPLRDYIALASAIGAGEPEQARACARLLADNAVPPVSAIRAAHPSYLTGHVTELR